MQAPLILIGLGAGAASALLYAAAVSGGTPFALVLLYVAPLPVLLAGVGWRHHAGLVAAGFGMVATGLVIGPQAGVFFAAAVGLPAWWLAYLALLARPGAAEGQTEWYPVGRLVVWCVVLGAGLVSVLVLMTADTLEAYRAQLREMFEKALTAAAAGGPSPFGKQDPKAVADVMARVAPSVAAAFWTLSTLANLWLAGRITRSSGRLIRPWPALARTELPRAAPFGLLAGLAGSFLPGLAGLAAELFATAFMFAFTLIGLATLHVTTRAVPARGLVLFALYAMLMLQPWIAVFLAGLGLSEHFFHIRKRFGAPPPPPPPTATANLP